MKYVCIRIHIDYASRLANNKRHYDYFWGFHGSNSCSVCTVQMIMIMTAMVPAQRFLVVIFLYIFFSFLKLYINKMVICYLASKEKNTLREKERGT